MELGVGWGRRKAHAKELPGCGAGTCSDPGAEPVACTGGAERGRGDHGRQVAREHPGLNDWRAKWGGQ